MVCMPRLRLWLLKRFELAPQQFNPAAKPHTRRAPKRDGCEPRVPIRRHVNRSRCQHTHGHVCLGHLNHALRSAVRHKQQNNGAEPVHHESAYRSRLRPCGRKPSHGGVLHTRAKRDERREPCGAAKSRPKNRKLHKGVAELLRLVGLALEEDVKNSLRERS